MLRGYYLAAQGMINKQRRLNCISNNISNINTSGYKRDITLTNTFKEQLILVKNRRDTSGTFQQTYVDTSRSFLDQGMFEFTESPFDVAANGPVFFNVEAYNGETMLTRSGQWQLDEEGYLSIGRAGRVLGENGIIFLGSKDFKIDEQGYIYTDEGMVDRLALTFIDENSDVTMFGENLFTAENAALPPDNEEWSIIQGAYEKSNVNLAYETTQAMEVQRLYEACSSVLKMIDAINAKSVDIGKI